MADSGRTRSRLNVIRFHIPPLRERRDDIVTIAKALLAGMAEKHPFVGNKDSPAAGNDIAEPRLARQYPENWSMCSAV